jgi:hypothetical protein
MTLYNYNFVMNLLLNIIFFLFLIKHLIYGFKKYILPILENGTKQEKDGWRQLNEEYKNLLCEKLEKSNGLARQNESIENLKNQIDKWRNKIRAKKQAELAEIEEIYKCAKDRQAGRDRLNLINIRMREDGSIFIKNLKKDTTEQLKGFKGEESLSKMLSELGSVSLG